MERRDYYLEQLLTEGELDAGFDGAEQAIWDLAADMLLTGVLSGLAVSESSPPALTVDVTLGSAYDQAGRRIRVDQDQDDFDCTVDENSIPTTVVTPGQERWLSLFAEYDRVLSDERIDGASQTVYFVRAEGFKLVIRQGAEAVAPAVKPALDPNLVLLADIKLVEGQASILNADIDTSRRQDFVIYSASQISFSDAGLAVLAGTDVQAAIASADAELASRGVQLDNHVAGAAQRHPGSDIDVSDGSWSALNGKLNAQTALDEVDARLTGLESFLSNHKPGILFFGGAPSDGGGLTLNINPCEWLALGEFFETTGVTGFLVDDDDVSYVYANPLGGFSLTGLPAGVPNHGVPIAKVTAVGGAITEIVDLRLDRDNEHKLLVVRVGSDNTCHFSRLSDAVQTLAVWRGIESLIRIEVELVGLVNEDDDTKLPIAFPSDNWHVRGLPGARMNFGGAAETLAVAFFDLTGVSNIVLEDIEISVRTSVAPSNLGHERFFLTASDAHRVRLTRVRQIEFDEGVHGWILFDPDTTCTDWIIEDCETDDCRDFILSAASPSPLTGGFGVVNRLQIRDCRFNQNSKGNRWTQGGISFGEGDDILIRNCRIEGFQASGVSAGHGDELRRLRVEDCRIIRPAGAYSCISLGANAEQCHVVGNDLDCNDANADGVVCFGDYNFIARNHTVATARFGVNTASGANNIVANNQSRGTGNNIGAGNTDDNNRDDV